MKKSELKRIIREEIKKSLGSRKHRTTESGRKSSARFTEEIEDIEAFENFYEEATSKLNKLLLDYQKDVYKKLTNIAKKHFKDQDTDEILGELYQELEMGGFIEDGDFSIVTGLEELVE